VSRGVNIRALRGFRAIVRLGSVTAAAAELGITQPALSRLLAQLEHKIDFELFYRDRGRLIPTNDAIALLDEVDQALTGIDRVERLVGDIAEHRVGQLRLVAPPSFVEGVMPPIVRRFLARFPDVHLTIESRSVDTSMAMIATHTVDGGFVKLPIARPDLEEETVVESDTVCVLPSDHPLAGERTLDPQLLKDQPLILLGLGRSSRIQIEAAFEKACVRPVVRIDTHTVASACALAAQGLGIAIVNELLVSPYLGAHLSVIAFKPHLPHAYAFATPAGLATNRLTRGFLEDVRAHFSETKRISQG
jgi:DNA-binding transcriptional LysR family regulator